MSCEKCGHTWRTRLDSPPQFCPKCINPRHLRKIRPDEPEVTPEVSNYKHKQVSIKELELPD